VGSASRRPGVTGEETPPGGWNTEPPGPSRETAAGRFEAVAPRGRKRGGEVVADILAFSAHPDDAEIGAGGTLTHHCRLGYEVVACDLTSGELATNGDPAARAVEAREAARLLGLSRRESLGLRDRALEPTPERVRAVAEVIRRHRPRLVLAPFGEDRHPDHAAAERLVREGVFSAGLARFAAAGSPHRVARLAMYFVNASPAPHFVVDVSAVYDTKRAVLRAYASQFDSRDTGAGVAGRPVPLPSATALNQGYLDWVELRDQWYGSLAGVARAEGFRWEGVLAVDDLVRRL
jgi:bacillithiol biosynthesis deacetylase BshB1